MKTIRVQDENVQTLQEVADELNGLYHWASYEVRARDGVIAFTVPDGRSFKLYETGFAYEVKDGIESDESDDEWSVDFRDDLDYTDLAWAEDEDGNAVAIHN